MRFTFWALSGLWAGTLVSLLLMAITSGTYSVCSHHGLVSIFVVLGATAGAWCGSLGGLHFVLETDEQNIAEYGCPVLLSCMLFSVVLPFWARSLPGCSLAYLLAPLLALGIMASGARTQVSPLLGLGMAAWLAAMLAFVHLAEGVQAGQLGAPLIGLVVIFLGAGAMRSVLHWKLPKMNG